MSKRAKLATTALLCISFAGTDSVLGKDEKPNAPAKKIYLVDLVTPAPKSNISLDALNTCGASDRLMKALAIYAPKNNLTIEKVSVAAAKQLSANVLRLEVDQIYNQISSEHRKSRLSVNARFIVSDGSQRGHNFDCSIEAELKPPYVSMFSCPRLNQCSKTIARDMAYWLTAFD